MTIKKAFKDLVEFLEANKKKTVADVMGKVTELCSAKSGGGGGVSNAIFDTNGKLTHIFCYYHKMFEPVNIDGKADATHVEYGKKANSSTGLNNMCKEGVSNWTKQNREFKNANAGLLNDVASGKVAPKDIAKTQEDLKSASDKIVPRKDKVGTKTAPGSEGKKAA